MKTDAQILAICRQMIFIQNEQQALVERDPAAPEPDSPNHEQHKALLAEYAALAAALTKAPPPTTLKGLRQLAKVAMTLAERRSEGELSEPQDFADWLWLFALTSATGKPEAIPLPEQLPDYWPA